MTSMTPTDLARHLIRARPGISNLTRDKIEAEARDYVVSSYAHAHSKVAASRSAGLPLQPDDARTMELLQPYVNDVSAVVSAVQAILSGQNPEETPSQDPATMTMAEYGEYRKRFSFTRPSRGIIP
jgi:hypothetical protein